MLSRRWRRRLNELEQDRPGRRFGRFHARRERWRTEHPAAARLVVVAGLLLMLVGVLLSIPPGIPGFLVTFAGLALAVAGSRFLAHLADRVELLVRHMVDYLRKRFRKAHDDHD